MTWHDFLNVVISSPANQCGLAGLEEWAKPLPAYFSSKSLDVWSRHMVDRIELVSMRLCFLGFAAELVVREAFERLESARCGYATRPIRRIRTGL